MREYYDRRAPEYDDAYLGGDQFGDQELPGFGEELAETTRVLAALRPARVLDVACGTGFLTRHLRGEVVGLDQSEAMLRIARERAPAATFLQGDALALPFADESFERVLTAHFYGHLGEADRLASSLRRAGWLTNLSSSTPPSARRSPRCPSASRR